MSKIPTIAMIPSAYKANKVYSVLPTNGDADLTFARTGEADRVNQIGLIESMATNVPRLDYSDGSCPSLSIEPQSTNLITNSEDFNDSDWTKLNSPTTTTNATLSPRGDLSADLLTATATNSQYFQSKTATGTGELFTASVFVKKSTSNTCRLDLRFPSGTNQNFAYRFDFDTETLTAQTSDIATNTEVESFNGGWYRIIVTAQNEVNASSNIALLLVIPDDTVGTNGTFYWGADLETDNGLSTFDGSYATSYIKTLASSVTRSAESVSKTGVSNYINSSEGVFYANLRYFSDYASVLAIHQDSTNNNRILIGSTGLGQFQCFVNNTNGDFLLTETTTLPELKQFNNIAVRWNQNSLSLWVNGVKVQENLSFISTSFSVDRISFSNATGSTPFYGYLKEYRVYNKALTDDEMANL